MKVKCYQVSSTGVVRNHNEDFISFWEPEDFFQRQAAGSIAVLADGVGGLGSGEVASKMAAETAVAIFKESKPDAVAADIIRRIYDESCAKVFEAARTQGRMATTLLTTIFRHNKAT